VASAAAVFTASCEGSLKSIGERINLGGSILFSFAPFLSALSI
jgi:hypothetical protein